MHLKIWPSQHPIRTLIISFIAWKTLLLLVAACSPGPGYDTSTSLSLSSPIENGKLPKPFDYMIGKLTRWDAIYFVKVSNRGYLFEQEWAWGWGFTHFLKFCTEAIVNAGFTHYEGLEALVGIGIAHFAHFLSVLALFNLTEAIFSASSSLPLAASFLHIISPAGIFLSAPYAESPCALLSFLGCLLFTKSLGSGKQSTSSQDVLVLLAGVLFGIATTFRSNGILNGLLLLEEAFRTLFLLRKGFQLTTVRRLVATGVGGLFVASGFLLPQYIAYNEYCSTTPSRPWCGRTLPSIYTFVQEHYWNVGLFRYWTLSNLPLFLLAAPVTLVMGLSGLWALGYNGNRGIDVRKGEDRLSVVQLQVLRNLAVSQLALMTLTLTTAHVQIITRLASAYPVWLWYVVTSCKEGRLFGRRFVLFMLMYGLIQAGLFASFLPPA